MARRMRFLAGLVVVAMGVQTTDCNAMAVQRFCGAQVVKPMTAVDHTPLLPLLLLRGGGSKSRSKRKDKESMEGKHEHREERQKDKKRTRSDRRAAAESSSPSREASDLETTGNSEESQDDLAYNTAPADGVGHQGAHPLGTAPVTMVAPPVMQTSRDRAKEDGQSSEEYPGCFLSSSEPEPASQEVEQARDGPLPTRAELIRSIRDLPFNASLVSVLLSAHLGALSVTRACRFEKDATRKQQTGLTVTGSDHAHQLSSSPVVRMDDDNASTSEHAHILHTQQIAGGRA